MTTTLMTSRMGVDHQDLDFFEALLPLSMLCEEKENNSGDVP